MKTIVWLFVACACLVACSSDPDEVLDPAATPDPTSMVSATDNHDTSVQNPAATAVTIADQALVDAFLGFVAEPSAERLTHLSLADSVALGLGEEIITTRNSESLVDPTNWILVRDESEPWPGPLSALWLVEPPVTITRGAHLRCVARPTPAPAGFENHRRVSLQPVTATSCLEWWAVDLFINPSGNTEAITIDLFAP